MLLSLIRGLGSGVMLAVFILPAIATAVAIVLSLPRSWYLMVGTDVVIFGVLMLFAWPYLFARYFVDEAVQLFGIVAGFAIAGTIPLTFHPAIRSLARGSSDRARTRETEGGRSGEEATSRSQNGRARIAFAVVHLVVAVLAAAALVGAFAVGGDWAGSPGVCAPQIDLSSIAASPVGGSGDRCTPLWPVALTGLVVLTGAATSEATVRRRPAAPYLIAATGWLGLAAGIGLLAELSVFSPGPGLLVLAALGLSGTFHPAIRSTDQAEN